VRKFLRIFLLMIAVCGVLGWAAYQVIAPSGAALSRYIPGGALLYLQANELSSLLSDWDRSPEKQSWLQSSNYEEFSRSGLFLRLKDAGDQFAETAGLPPDEVFLKQVSGKQSALALYDIGKLQFLYLSRLPLANSMQTGLWQTRNKFETRSAGGETFYFRRDPGSEREVAFAIHGDYLLLATREDLMAGALQLLAGGNSPTIEADSWWARSVAASGPTGDIRMVLNLERIVATPYFRSYWIQRNVTDIKKYASAVSDLFLTGNVFREERVLLKASPPFTGDTREEDFRAASDLARLVSSGAGFYEASAAPSAEECLELLNTKILSPRLAENNVARFAPQFELSQGVTGSALDMETHIDEAPIREAAATDRAAPLKALLAKNRVRAMLQARSTTAGSDGVFVHLHSAVAFLAENDWDDAPVRATLAEVVGRDLTTLQLGTAWRQQNGYQELDGLRPLLVATRGKYMFVSDDSVLMNGLLANMSRPSNPPALLIAGFDHQRERDNLARLSGVVDHSSSSPAEMQFMSARPEFFSKNMASLSTVLSAVRSENIVIRDAGDKLVQTVIYQWNR